MKRTLFVTTILFCAFLSNAQKYVQIDKVSQIFMYEYRFCEIKKNRNSLKAHEMILEVGNKFSKFYSISKSFADSLLMLYANESPENASAKILPKVMGSPVPLFCNYYVYKNYPYEGVTIFTATDMGMSAHYKTEEKLNFNWKIDSSADTVILGYKCKKAVTTYGGRKYTAWFTTGIPINDGPYKFAGLPGLIVSVADAEEEHVFSLIGIKKAFGKKMYFIQRKYVPTSGKGYVNALEASKDGFIKELERGRFNDEAVKYKAITRVKQRNNYIERY